MPRFINIGDKPANNLVCFGNVYDYQDSVIKPSKKVTKDLLKNEWDNALWVFASIALKKTTQSQIVRKLLSFKMNKTLKAIMPLMKS